MSVGSCPVEKELMNVLELPLRAQQIYSLICTALQGHRSVCSARSGTAPPFPGSETL